MSLKQGSIVLVDFSYSNLKETKFRPSLVLSNYEYNGNSMDVVVLRVTSRCREGKWEVEILRTDLAEGTLDIEPSYVKVDSIFTVEKSIIRKVVARLKDEKIEEIKRRFFGLYRFQTDIPARFELAVLIHRYQQDYFTPSLTEHPLVNLISSQEF
ncbi:MAG: type II toxin-antitoxin system PemK/MazF family toxin [Candidatus Methanoperedens sp.]|nr:type II toxin-antitoxin system PemK/MazF family toxin [Candidatus Methanoperedens sp.]